MFQDDYTSLGMKVHESKWCAAYSNWPEGEPDSIFAYEVSYSFNVHFLSAQRVAKFQGGQFNHCLHKLLKCNF